MKFFAYIWLVLLLSFTVKFNSVHAQSLPQQQLSEKMLLYGVANPPATLFVHFDKNIYTNNETVWFTGFLLKANEKELAKHTVLSVALIRDPDSVIIKQDKYLMGNGFSFGSMVLPDTMITGNYHFLVTTNKVIKGKPDVSFIQPIVIKTNIDPAFNAGIKLLEAAGPDKKSHQVIVSVLTRDNRFLPKPAEISYKYGAVTNKAMTNASGQLMFSLPGQTALTDPNVYVTVKYGKDISFINLPLPVAVKKAQVKFYPEGGNIIAGLEGNVAWEVKDGQGGLVALKAQLLRDGVVKDTVETNSYGIGQFKLSAERGHIYTVKLLHSGFADSTYRLPAAVGSGIGLTVKNAAAKDTLQFKLSSLRTQKITVRLHDFVSTYFYHEHVLTESGQTFKIPLTGISKGLKAITVFDSMGRPIVERIVFTRYDSLKKVDVATGKQVYGQREKVTLKLKMSSTDTIGLVSVACVQDNRLSAALNNDIESYTYLKNELNTLPVALNGRGFESREYVENILLTKGWRRYTWQDISRIQPADTLKLYDMLAIKLIVKKKKEPIEMPVNICVMKYGKTEIDSTNAQGILTFKDLALTIEEGHKVSMFIAEKNPADYSVHVHDPYAVLNKDYVKTLHMYQVALPSAVQNNHQLLLKNNERVIRLKEVKITSGKDYALHYNECGEFVCKYGFLNCPPHIKDPGNIPPVIGTTYKVYTGHVEGQDTFYYTVYRGCKDASLFMPIPGIYTRKEFYTDEYKDPLVPAFVSTLYWNHGVLLGIKEKEFNFYTGDITGKFRIVVQGITNNELVYGQHTFEVK